MTAQPSCISDDPAAARALAAVRVLYTDIDGTLVAGGGSVLANAAGEPSTAVADAIVTVARRGLDIVPVSGRSRTQLREFTQVLGWNSYIAEAGGILVHGTGLDAEVRLDRGVWPDDLLPEGVTPFDAINNAHAAETLMAAFPGRIEHYAPWQMTREVSLLLRGCLDRAEGQRVLDTLPLPLDLVDNGMVRNPGTLQCSGTPPHAYHVVPRGVSKTRAIELDLAWRGLSRDQAAAIGDSATDLDMADAVGVMVLVANAFGSPSVVAELDKRPRHNVWCTHGERTDGWSEFARTWVSAAHTP